MTEPSKVIHVRNVGHEISENDLLQLFQPFGVITKLVMLRAKNQALIQMQDVPSAVNALQFYANVQPSIRGRNVYVQFSSHQELTTMEQSQGRGDEPNRILLVTVHHMLYPMTVDVLYQVFSPHGSVEKIVTFQKSAGFQALIQYQSRQSAVAARSTLQGRNIYDGCCQLDIQFSNLDELQVNYNNDRSRDFTNPNLPTEQKGRPSQPGYGDAGNMYAAQGSGARAAIAAAFGGGLPPGITGTNDRCTVLVSNLNPDRIDEDKLFNLFSIYGNIVRIKLLRNKPDHALIQMGDGFQAELAVHFLKGAMLFEKRLEVNFSKHPNITQGADTHEYINSNLNRFNRNAAKNYRYCCSPTKMIHLSTLPQDITEEEIVSLVEEHGTIVNSKVFEMNGKKQALVQFGNEEQATEALVCKHASTLSGSVIRISFSQLQNI
ncbi:Polypyrimidine tract-binding 3 [Glycine soja]